MLVWLRLRLTPLKKSVGIDIVVIERILGYIYICLSPGEYEQVECGKRRRMKW